MSTVVDYVGRTVDVVAYQGSGFGGERQLTQSLGRAEDGRGMIITGIVKLGQRFILELLTEQGSMQFLPTRGCTFMTEARLGYFRNQVDVLAALSRALIGIKRNLKSEESNSDPDDERYGSVVVDSIEYVAGEVKLFLSLTSRAGAVTVVLPISVSI